MKKKILITGASGYIGEHILSSIIKENVDIYSVTRNPQKIKHQEKINVVYTNDIFNENADWWESKLKSIDTIIHLAWYAEPGKYLNSLENVSCLEGSIRLAKAAVNAGVRRFIGIGTCFEYDCDRKVLNTDTPLKPTTIYSSTKVALYYTLKELFKISKIEFVWCRIFYLYGGYNEDKRRLVPYIKESIKNNSYIYLSSGNQIRDFMHVRDAASEITAISLSNYCGAINICSGEPITVKQIANRIASEHDALNLLKYGVRQENIVEPPCILGIKTAF